MQYVLLIYQGAAWETIADRSEEERQSLIAEYAELNATPGITPGLALGLPQDATTVRVQDGRPLITDGPLLGAAGAVGGWAVFETDDRDAALELATRVPAARLGGAIEVRPVNTYW
jgi:hypothetical protein